MLVHRFVLFGVIQGLIAVSYLAAGAPAPFRASAAWWPASAAVTNLVSVFLLRFLARQEGLTYGRLVNADFRKEHIGKDLLALLGVLVLAGPIGMLPNTWIAQVLFGDANIANTMFILPLPTGLALALPILFALTQSIGELPTYFGYVMPRLAPRWSGYGWAIVVSALWLGLQHATLPMLADWRFVVWRATMFIPFALLLGVVVRWRPRLLPYLMVVHSLIDLPVGIMVVQASVGG
jgi:hypothetical protein